MSKEGHVSVRIESGIARVAFFHPKKNSMPGDLLRKLADEISRVGEDVEARVVVLESEGDGPFCAGASFDELLKVDSMEKGRDFFMGFARLILAMKKCPKFIIARVQGKAVGGGVGIVAASDYVLAVEQASIKLSELAIGIGPFIIGPAVERKVGVAAFSALSVDADWREAQWARSHDLYTEVYEDMESLDKAVDALAARLAGFNPEAMAGLKTVFWEGTEHWDDLLPKRAEISGRLVLSEFTSNAISAFKRG